MAEVSSSMKSGDNGTVETAQSGITDLSKFVVKRILNNNAQRKTIFVEGHFTDKGGKAVLILDKPAFDDKCISSLKNQSELKNYFVNDVYGNYECYPDPKFNGLKTTLIFPATDKHVQKYEFQPFHMIDETKEFYETITLPYLTQNQFNLKWVYNILEHKSEVDRIVVEDEDPNVGFVLLPDLKWDGNQETLYLLAIVRPRGLRSIRDLTSEHLPLLYNVRDKVTKAIEAKYNIGPSQLRVFFHYQPSFYHLHIHFTYLQYEAPGILTEKAHLLSTVINNIQLRSDYYQEATLPFSIKESYNLFSCYEQKGIVKRTPPKENDGAASSIN